MFSKENLDEMMAKEVDEVVKFILERIEEKVKEKTDRQKVAEFLAKGHVYIGYPYRVDEACNNFKEYSENELAWSKIWKMAEPILLTKFTEAGWKLDEEKMNLIPDK